MDEERKSRKSTGGKKTTDYDFMLEIAGNNEMDFREYTEKVKDELKSLEDYCITDYLAVNKDVAILYEELGRSNDILDRIENIVTKFQTKLGNISENVSKLQEKSNKYNIALNNRRELEKELHEFLDGILLSPQLVQDLIQNDIDLKYLEKLDEFNKILANVDEAISTSQDSKAIKDVIEEIEKLTIQVCHKIRSFLLSKFYSLHKDKTNFQIVQQNMLIRYKSLNVFLRAHSQDKYIEVTNQYAEYMSKRYYNDVKDYSTECAKLVKERITSKDVVIIDEYKFKSSGEKLGLNQIDLEDRENILLEINSEPIVPYHKNASLDKISLEEAFRSQNQLLINLITSEYSFVLEFFDLKASQCDFIFNTIFSKTVNLFLDWLTTA